MIQHFLFDISKLLKIISITKRFGNFSKLSIQLYLGISYPELTFIDVRVHEGGVLRGIMATTLQPVLTVLGHISEAALHGIVLDFL